MQSKYQAWVVENVTETFGKCKEITHAMVKAFPKLTRVRGFYMCADWGKRAHWWLVDAEGKVVDPTADQFPSQGTSEYAQWIEGSEEPTDKCMNCGGYTYGAKRACSVTCAEALEKYYGCAFAQ